MVSRAFSVPIESERRLYFFFLTRFLDANRHPLLVNALDRPDGGPSSSVCGGIGRNSVFRMIALS